ncbi:hypothetical protein EIP91_011810 [Steccherinum ochraceum]|uniref:Uncharacterized protein n=1 Tax=Steccherinum ochraceum TaxID=92696 RepID=A0A4R0RK96_9APHY|nr:hypothetical protein EIP91_011810 [Steccherinum ochraceum]
MGRPLYSSSIISSSATLTSLPPAPTATTTTTPAPDVAAIRSPPDVAPEQPEIRNWSYWNAFDPDADEFFDGPNAVYEAFVDPTTLPPLREEIAMESAAARRERRMSLYNLLTVRAAREGAVSPGSDRSASETASPSTPDIVERYIPVHSGPPDDDSEDEGIEEAPVVPAITSRLDPQLVYDAVDDELPDISILTPPHSPRITNATTATTTTTTPLVFSPSPPPTVTPRLFTWAPRNAYPPSPLPNRSARMSVAHISPAYIPATAIVNRVHG